MDISSIKLVIWDLDDTFWKGTLSEGGIEPIQDCIDAVKTLSECGIVSSICSKNDSEPCVKKLSELNILDYFVFKSINWEPKGQRVKRIIDDMNLRAANVLFIDDSHMNLEEARYYCPELTTASPDVVPELLRAAKTAPKDTALERLNRYKVLEKKQRERQGMTSNEEFLKQSNIRVDIHTDCIAELDRIAELVMRTNQLNFTKVRSSKDELRELLSDSSVTSGYITASDKYGEYGIIGFFAYRGGELIHFLFSCRTLGMGVEQYVYERLGFPRLQVEGDVSVKIGADAPKTTWINNDTQSDENEFEDVKNADFKVLMKGPCDLNQIFSFIKNEDMFDCEFTYVSREKQSMGVTIEGMNHTSQIVAAYSITDGEKKELCDLPICDSEMYPDSIYRNKYGVIFLSVLTDANLGLYRKKNGGQVFAFGEYLYPMTNPDMWDKYINKEVYTANCTFKKEDLEKITSEYEFLGRLTAEETAENLMFIYEHIKPDTQLVIMLGCEREYRDNILPAWEERHNDHKKINAAVRAKMSGLPNVTLFDINDYIVSDNDFNDSINHYKKRIYYLIAERFTAMINECAKRDVSRNTSKAKLLYLTVKQRIKKLIKPHG